MRVEAIYASPVKSLALNRVDRADVGPSGIVDDRRFFLASERGRLLTQRECPSLVQVRASYSIPGRAGAPERLRLEFPDGRAVEGEPVPGEPATTRFFGKRDVEGFVVEGEWAEALSEFAGVKLKLVRAKKTAFDALPISVCSTASLDALRTHSGESSIDARRFRPNFLVSGVDAHGEDAWIDHDVRIGSALVRVQFRDPRCEMITHDPDTGARDMNTLRMIAAYRTDQPKEVNFGVYGSVVAPGIVRVGDEIAVS